MSTTFASITITDTATQILAARGERRGLVIHNISTSPIYIGPDNTITISNTIFIGPGEKLAMGSLQEAWVSTLFGIVASGTAEVRFWEWGQGN